MKFVPSQHLTGGNRCAITGRSTDPEGFIQTNNILAGVDPQIELSAAAVKEAARILGWFPPEEVQALKDESERLKAEFAEAVERIDKLTQFKELETELTT